MDRLFEPFDVSANSTSVSKVPVPKPRSRPASGRKPRPKLETVSSKNRNRDKGQEKNQKILAADSTKTVSTDSVDMYHAAKIIQALGQGYTRYYEYNATRNNVSWQCICQIRIIMNGTMFPYGIDIRKPQVGMKYIVMYKFYAVDNEQHTPCTHGTDTATWSPVEDAGSNLDFNHYVKRTMDSKSIPTHNKNDCHIRYESLLRDERFTYKC